MKLFEKKCPNCGAKLEFGDTDSSCTCSYCGRSFEIEREKDKYKLINETFNDNLEKSKEFINNSFAFSKTYVAIVSFIACIIIAVVFINILNISKNHNIKTNDSIYDDVYTEDKVEYLSNANEISNTDVDYIYSSAHSSINNYAEGSKESKNGYRAFRISDGTKRVKIYVAYKKDTNYLIVIFKATYENVYNTDQRKTVYIPVVYENIEKSIHRSLGNAKLKAPKYYLTKDKKLYTYGYKDLDTVYNKIIKPLESQYVITSK